MAFYHVSPSRGSFGESFGAGLGQGIANIANMTLQQKLASLENQRKISAEQQARESSAMEAQNQGFGNIAKLIRAGFGPREITKLATEYGFPELSPTEQIHPQEMMDQQFSPQQMQEKEEEIPYEDREAIEEEMSPRVSERKEPRTLEDFQRKIAKNFEKLPKTAQERVSRQAEREFNAAMSERKEELSKEKFEYEKQKPLQNLLSETQKKLQGWHKQKPILTYMKQHANEIKSGAGVRKNIAKLLHLPEATFLSNPEQVMDKMATQLLMGVSSIFPGRILVSELETYMRANPSLANSPEALKAISDVILESGKLIEDEYSSMKKYSKEIKDKNEVFDKVQEELEPKYEELNENINKIISSSFSKKSPKTFEQTVMMINPSGQVGAVPINKVSEAEKAGYKRK